jgi:hypothetical protein
VSALPAHAADKFRVRYATVREPGSDNCAADHSPGIILLDGQFIRKFAFATPVDQITAQLVEILVEYPVTPTWGRCPRIDFSHPARYRPQHAGKPAAPI